MPLKNIEALAKINLSLHVGEVQSDGYHPVDTLCVFAPAGDRLIWRESTKHFSLSIKGQEASLSAQPDNLVLKAARLMASATDIAPCHFELEKHVPVASGIGGGTANGAAAMVLLNERARTPLSRERMMSLAQGLGADGPVCLAPYLFEGASFRATGIGYEVEKGPSLPPLYICLANPNQRVPTGQVFQAFDAKPAPTPFALPRASRLASYRQLAAYMASTRNDLASPAMDICPAISATRSRMRAQAGNLTARMSGSGATVFGLFVSALAADRAARQFRAIGNWAIAAPLHYMKGRG